MRTSLVLVGLLVSLVGCRSDEPGPPVGEPVAEVEAPAPVELPAELAARTWDASVASIEMPQWAIAVVEVGEDPRPLVYRPAEVSRQVRFVLSDEGGPRMTTTLHWWSFGPASLEFGFAGIDGGLPPDPALAGSEIPPEVEKTIALADEAFRAGVQQIRGQVQTNGSRLIHVAQTEGQPMTPSVAEVLELFTVPLPHEPIGIGGAWTASQTADGQTTTRRYRLSKVEGAQLTIEFGGTSTPPSGPDETFNGTFVVSLFDPLARSGNIESVSHLPAPPNQPPEEFRMRFELTTVEK